MPRGPESLLVARALAQHRRSHGRLQRFTPVSAMESTTASLLRPVPHRRTLRSGIRCIAPRNSRLKGMNTSIGQPLNTTLGAMRPADSDLPARNAIIEQLVQRLVAGDYVELLRLAPRSRITAKEIR